MSFTDGLRKLFSNLKPTREPKTPLEYLKAQFPGGRVITLDEAPADIREKLQAKLQAESDKFKEGKCTDCGCQCPNWPKINGDEGELPEMPEGWRTFSDVDGFVVAIQCPECDAKDTDGLKMIQF